MKTALFHPALIYSLAIAISFAVAALIKVIDRVLRHGAKRTTSEK